MRETGFKVLRLIQLSVLAGLLGAGDPPKFLILGDPAGIGQNLLIYDSFRFSVAVILAVALYLRRASFLGDMRSYARLFKRERDDRETASLRALSIFVALAAVAATAGPAASDVLARMKTLGLPAGQVLKTNVLPILSILTAWAMAFGVFVGLGLLVRRMFVKSELRLDNLIGCFWTGFAAALPLVTIWHFFARISIAALAALGVAAAIGWAVSFGRVREAFRRRTGSSGVLILLFFIAAFHLAAAGLFPPYSSDAGLYDFSAIKWVKSFPAVPGLGNLHFRFAFNNASHLYSALLDQGPWAGRAFHFAGNLLILALVGRILLSLRSLFGRDGKPQAADLYYALLLAPALYWSQTRYASSPNPDALLFPLGAMLSGMIVSLLADSDSDRETFAWRFFQIGFLAAAGVTVKLSFAAVAACCVLIGFSARRMRSHTPSTGRGKTASLIMAAAIFQLLPWMAHGVVLSGYPVFPSTIFGSNAPWRMPPEVALKARHDTMLWARGITDYDLPIRSLWENHDWMSTWARERWSAFYDFPLPLILGVVFLLIALFFRRLNNNEPRGGPLWAALAPPAAGILFWFALAPADQFEGAAFWSLAGAAFALAVAEAAPAFRGVRVDRAAAAVCVIAGIVVFQSLLVRPGLRPGFCPIPAARLGTFTTESGLRLNVPEGGLCWDGELPCTPIPDTRLHLRRPPDLGSGFLKKKD